MTSSIRGKNCYLCGEELGDDGSWYKSKVMKLDGKERRVHSFCKKDYERAMADFERYALES